VETVTTDNCRNCDKVLREEIPGIFGNVKIATTINGKRINYGSFCSFSCANIWGRKNRCR
jgi:hypothetical protein